MFNKKKHCEKCHSSVKGNFDFCPHCGNNLGGEEWGMLGKNDAQENRDPLANSMFGGLSGNIMNKMFNNVMKMMEKEMQREMNDNTRERTPRTKVQLFINGKRVDLNGKEIKQERQEQPARTADLPKTLAKNKLKKFSELPRKDPKTNIRRLSDKIVYEIEMPGVNSLENVSIVKLENSIEIKAVSKTKAYYKIIQIDLPIQKTNLTKGKLILELEAKN